MLSTGPRFAAHVAGWRILSPDRAPLTARFSHHCASCAVNGVPSCHLMPSRILKVHWVNVGSDCQLSATPGAIWLMSSRLYFTRLAVPFRAPVTPALLLRVERNMSAPKRKSPLWATTSVPPRFTAPLELAAPV